MNISIKREQRFLDGPPWYHLQVIAESLHEMNNVIEVLLNPPYIKEKDDKAENSLSAY